VAWPVAWPVRLGATTDSREAAEPLAAGAAAGFPDPAAATAWRAAREGGLLARGPRPVRAACERLAPPAPPAASVRRAGRADGAGRVDRLASPALRLDGRPIGSGALESAADHVVQGRMQRAGMRWSEAGGDARLALRARHHARRPRAA
jgi:hypothetical protein